MLKRTTADFVDKCLLKYTWLVLLQAYIYGHLAYIQKFCFLRMAGEDIGFAKSVAELAMMSNDVCTHEETLTVNTAGVSEAAKTLVQNGTNELQKAMEAVNSLKVSSEVCRLYLYFITMSRFYISSSE